jgi:hypothetical protein
VLVWELKLALELLGKVMLGYSNFYLKGKKDSYLD